MRAIYVDKFIAMLHTSIIKIIYFILASEVIEMTKPKGKYAWTVKIGEKGQFVIPKEARDIFDINPGDTIIVLADEKKGIAIPPKNTFEELAMEIFADSLDMEE